MPLIKDQQGSNKNADRIPEICPHCQTSISVIHVYSRNISHKGDQCLQIIYACPNQKCKNIIVATFVKGTYESYELAKIEPQKSVLRKFTNEIEQLSPQFVKIYNQAYNAEIFQLLEVCGPGYRKALEFLVKDYLISNNTGDEEDIKKIMLSPCIKKYIKDDNIKFCAERAVWVGNDETHYVRKWDNKDLQDLKQLIDLTVNWITNEILTARFRLEMPNN